MYGGPQVSHQNQMLTANYKSLTSNSNRSQQIQIAHIKFKSLTANYKHSQQITNRSQQIQMAQSKFKSFTANYKLLTPVGVFGYLQPAVQLVFKLGKAGWYCVTKGNILLRASLFFCLSDAFLSLNLTTGRCFDPANNGQTGYINSTSRKYSYCYQKSQWQLTRFQVESKPQSLRIYILIMAEILTAGGLWKQAILATKRGTLSYLIKRF